MADRMNIISIVREAGGQSYVFWYDETDELHDALLRQVGFMAASSEVIGFGWCEAAGVCKRANALRQMRDKPL